MSITLRKLVANDIPTRFCIPSVLTETPVDMMDSQCYILKDAADTTLLLRLRADSSEELVVNSDKDMSTAIFHFRGLSRARFNFSYFRTKLIS